MVLFISAQTIETHPSHVEQTEVSASRQNATAGMRIDLFAGAGAAYRLVSGPQT
jgi:hypothetical protein